MTLNTYTYYKDKRVVDKSAYLINEASYGDVNPKDRISILNPSFVLRTDNFNFAHNYCYCPEFGRYYFIDSIDVDTGGRTIINCSIDVLMTYRSQIPDIVAQVVRAETLGRPTLINDGSLATNPRVFPTIIKASNSLFNTTTANNYSNNFIFTVV